MTPGAGVLVLGMDNVSSLLVYTGSWTRQINFVVMLTKEASTKIVHFMESVAEVVMEGCGLIGHHNDYGLSSTLSIYNAFVVIVLREYYVSLICHC